VGKILFACYGVLAGEVRRCHAQWLPDPCSENVAQPRASQNFYYVPGCDEHEVTVLKPCPWFGSQWETMEVRNYAADSRVRDGQRGVVPRKASSVREDVLESYVRCGVLV